MRKERRLYLLVGILLALTWSHRTPADTPTSPCILAIGNEQEVDSVALRYKGWQGGASIPAASLVHQCCIVTIRDC